MKKQLIKKELNTTYFGIGIRENYVINGYEFYFYWFKLKQYPPMGEIIQRGRDYNGFNIIWEIRIPEFGINI